MASTAKSSNNVSTPEGLPEIKVGEIFAGAYRIIRLLGEGGMGSVYLARDIRSGNREVALKILHGGHVRAETRSGEFSLGSLGGQSAEARFLASCEHPSILPVYDAGVDAETGFAYLSMRPCLLSSREVAHLCDDIFHCPYPHNPPPGDAETRPLTLRDLVKGGKALPQDAVARIGIDLVEALAYTHGQSPPIVHRDIKPSNILLDAKGHAILSDFGIAKSLLIEDCPAESSAPSTLQPCEGRPVFAGTPIYASPEQKNGELATTASDYYSLGVVLHEMLTGERPWGEIAPSKYDRAHISHRWDGLLRGLLADDPHDRLSDSGVILRTLRALLRRSTARRRAFPALCLAGAAAAAAVEILFSLSREHGSGTFVEKADPVAVLAARKADVAIRLEQLRNAPAWPDPSKTWFPAILLPPRPENNRRHSSCRVYEMRLPDGTPMQFVPYSCGPEKRHRYDLYIHGYFQPDDESGNVQGDMDDRLTVVSKRLMVSRTEVTQEQFNAVLAATNSIPLWEMRATEWTNGPAIMEKLGIGPVEYGHRFALLSYPQITEGRKLSEICWHTVFTIRPFDVPPPQGMPAAEGIRYADVEQFIAKLNSLCPPGCVFRLPTEAEWESICRHMDLRRFEGDVPDNVCWSRENSGGAPHPVAQKAMNYLGIYDMHGNVAEWCLDGFLPIERPAFDPLLPVPKNRFHVVRGGSWADPAEECGSEVRKGAGPDATGIGFRLVLEY
jgi:serine/threonine protein kinase